MNAHSFATSNAKLLRRELTDARAVCLALGFSLSGATSKQAHISCPWHEENTPSCSVHRGDDGTLAVRCHGCRQSGDVLTLIAAVRGLDIQSQFREVLAEAAQLACRHDGSESDRIPSHVSDKLSDERYDEIVRTLLEHTLLTRLSAAGEYLTHRGIFADAQAVGIGAIPQDRKAQEAIAISLITQFGERDVRHSGLLAKGAQTLSWPNHVILIPWRNQDGTIVSLQRRILDNAKPKYVVPRDRSPSAPFGIELLSDALEYLGEKAEIIFVEGAFDTLARRRVARLEGECAAVLGVSSASNPTQGLPLELLRNRNVVLALDNDSAGEEACKQMNNALMGIARTLSREVPEGGRDWNTAMTEAWS